MFLKSRLTVLLASALGVASLAAPWWNGCTVAGKAVHCAGTGVGQESVLFIFLFPTVVACLLAVALTVAPYLTLCRARPREIRAWGRFGHLLIGLAAAGTIYAQVATARGLVKSTDAKLLQSIGPGYALALAANSLLCFAGVVGFLFGREAPCGPSIESLRRFGACDATCDPGISTFRGVLHSRCSCIYPRLHCALNGSA